MTALCFFLGTSCDVLRHGDIGGGPRRNDWSNRAQCRECWHFRGQRQERYKSCSNVPTEEQKSECVVILACLYAVIRVEIYAEVLWAFVRKLASLTQIISGCTYFRYSSCPFFTSLLHILLLCVCVLIVVSIFVFPAAMDRLWCVFLCVHRYPGDHRNHCSSCGGHEDECYMTMRMNATV